MLGKTVRLHGDHSRWLELTVEIDRAIARVGCEEKAEEPFPFNFENLGFVPYGLGYQAWGGGSHFSFRKTAEGFVVEFQGSEDRSPAVCRLSDSELASTIDNLGVLAPGTLRAVIL